MSLIPRTNVTTVEAKANHIWLAIPLIKDYDVYLLKNELKMSSLHNKQADALVNKQHEKMRKIIKMP